MINTCQNFIKCIDGDLPIIKMIDIQRHASYACKAVKFISIYKGIIVVWDEDFDTRILGAIDKLDRLDDGLNNVIAIISEHEGFFSITWKTEKAKKIYEPYFEEYGLELSDDYWTFSEGFVL